MAHIDGSVCRCLVVARERLCAGCSSRPRTLEALKALVLASDPMVRGATRAVLGERPIGAPAAFAARDMALPLLRGCRMGVRELS